MENGGNGETANPFSPVKIDETLKKTHTFLIIIIINMYGGARILSRGWPVEITNYAILLSTFIKQEFFIKKFSLT